MIQVVLQVKSSPENDYASTKLVQANLVRTTGFRIPIQSHSQTPSPSDSHPCVAGQQTYNFRQNLPIIPALLQAAVLALLSAAIPLRATATCTVIAVVAGSDGEAESNLILDPSPREAEGARSVHALAFTSGDRLILAESEGHFTMQEWADVHAKALKICCEPVRDPGNNDMDMGDDNSTDVEGPNMRHFIRETMAAKVSADLHWKG